MSTSGSSYDTDTVNTDEEKARQEDGKKAQDQAAGQEGVEEAIKIAPGRFAGLRLRRREVAAA
jgi:hypothetical protein